MSTNENQPTPPLSPTPAVPAPSVDVKQGVSADVEAIQQIALTLQSFPDAEGFWLLVTDHKPHIYTKLLWVRQFNGDWQHREKGGKWWSCRTGHWFELPLDQLSRIILSSHAGNSPAVRVEAEPERGKRAAEILGLSEEAGRAFVEESDKTMARVSGVPAPRQNELT